MKVWIDLTNSPHVNFFADMIRDLDREHDLLLTCRPLANTIELLEMNGFPHHVVGRHYGQSKLKKASGFLVRIWQLRSFLKTREVDVAISHSSFYSPVVSRLLGIPCIYLNDNEHAAGNRISFLFADCIMVPEFLSIEKVKSQGAKPSKIIQYPGVKEGVYLWNYSPAEQCTLQLPDRGNRRVIFVRPEPWTAQYYKGERNFMDPLLLRLKEEFKIVLLPRGKAQDDYYRQERFEGITVPDGSISLQEIMAVCDLFIGAGGTMTREAAVLGIPTISIYQDELLDVDNYLIDKGFMVHQPNLDADFVVRFFDASSRQAPDTELLAKGRQAYELIKKKMLENGTRKRRNQ